MIAPQTEPNDMSFLETLARATRAGRAYTNVEQQMGQQDALKQLAGQMQTGEIKPQDALFEYAGITGDYAPIFGAGARQPASLQEWAAYQGMSPEQKKEFLNLQRGGRTANLGDRVVVLGPDNMPQYEMKTNLKPGETPEVRGAQQAAVEEAKASAAEGAEERTKAKEASESIDLLTQAEKYLEVASSGYLDAAGAFGKRVVGTSDEETQANAQLKVIGGRMLKNVPRMEGPQSDKDVQTYKDAAGNLQDATVPVGDRLAAIKTIREMLSKYDENGVDTTTSKERYSARKGANKDAGGSKPKRIKFSEW